MTTPPTPNSRVSDSPSEHQTRRFGKVGRGADVVAGVSSVVTIAGMIATPLLPRGGRGRRLLSSVVVTGMFATSAANATRRWGASRAGVAAAATAVSTAIVERIGVRTGLPFGRYAYTDALRPQVAHVPVIVPLAWFGMGLPSREAASAALGERSTPPTRIVLGSLAMTAWDLFLDPQMTGEGYWRWAKRGAYRGIPLGNFAGWFVTGVGIMTLFEALLPPRRDDHSARTHADPRLVGEYGYMSVMQTLGFARYFRDPVVAAVGGAGMLPIALAATVNLVRGRA